MNSAKFSLISLRFCPGPNQTPSTYVLARSYPLKKSYLGEDGGRRARHGRGGGDGHRVGHTGERRWRNGDALRQEARDVGHRRRLGQLWVSLTLEVHFWSLEKRAVFINKQHWSSGVQYNDKGQNPQNGPSICPRHFLEICTLARSILERK